MGFDIKEMVKSKDALRRKLAERPISEKLRMTEDLSERTLALRPDTSPSPPDAPWPIPSHWQWKKMADVATVIGGGTPATDHKEYFGGDIPWITPADLSKYTEKTISRGARNITQAGLNNSGARLVPPETVLFSSRAPIGYVAIAANPVATNQGFKSFVLNDEITPEFVYYYLQRARGLVHSLASGTTFLEISGKKAAQIPIPVPPVDEQRRIVAEIETQFTRLDAGVAALGRVQANLKRYRAAVLKAACEGRIVAGDIGNWNPITLEDVCYKVTDGDHQPPPKAANGIPFLTIGNISSGQLDFSDTRFVPEEYFARIKPDRVPQVGDVLYSVVGATIGIPVLVDTERKFCFQRHIALLKPSAAILPKFLRLFMASPKTYRDAWSKTTGSAQPTLPLKALRSLPIALPPLPEQALIVAEVERRLSVVEELETAVSANLQRAVRLRQSILNRSFGGKTV